MGETTEEEKRMIHLDTNVLIDVITPHSATHMASESWVRHGENLAVSSVTWMEFCNGPLEPMDKELALRILNNQIIDFDSAQAELASRLFNATGRRRSSRADCMIASTAITSEAPLVTYNQKDFDKFTPHGLKLENISTDH